MGMDPISWAVIGAAAVSAGSSVMAGDAAKEEARKNGLLLEEKALMTDIAKGLETKQYDRLANKTMGTSIANIGTGGIAFSGSAMASILDTQKQIAIDKAIGQLGFDQEKKYTRAEADAGNRAGARAQKAGYYDAFSTMLSAGSNVGRYNISQGATRAGR